MKKYRIKIARTLRGTRYYPQYRCILTWASFRTLCRDCLVKVSFGTLAEAEEYIQKYKEDIEATKEYISYKYIK